MKKSTILALLFCSAISIPIHADTRPDDHAPIGVINEHTHSKGEFMLSYRYMSMSKSDLRQDSHDTSADSVRETYMMAPTDMEMSMHMFGVMYAPNDRTTYAVMVSTSEKDMTMENKMGVSSHSQTSGMGDIKITALTTLLKTDTQRLHLINGLSLPLGSIDEKSVGTRLPYGMQLGSGTVDLKTGVTYVTRKDKGSTGLQSLLTLRPGLNKYGYAFGHKGEVSAWKAQQLNHHTSASLRTSYSLQSGIRGEDASQNTAMSPGRTTENGQSLLVLAAGLNTIIGEHRLSLEYSHPIYESVQGVQMKSTGFLVFGWQLAI